MTPVSLVLKRARAHFALLFALLLASAVLSFVVCGTLGYLAASSTTGVRSMLASAPASEAALQVQTGVAADPAKQEAAATSLFHGLFRGVPVDVFRTLRSDPLDLRAVNGATLQTGSAQLIAGSDPDLAAHAVIVQGSWPAATAAREGEPVPAALQATAASALGIRVGDELTIGATTESQRVTVVATWLPKDPSAALWFDDSAPASGFAGAAAGPLIMDDASVLGLTSEVSVRWTIVPTLAKLIPGDLPALATAAQRVESAVEHSSLFETSATTSSGLPRTVAEIERATVASSSIGAVQLVLVLAIGLITLGSLARLLAVVRRTEAALLLGRGSTVARMTIAALVETATLVIPGSVVGVVVAGLVLPAVVGTVPNWGVLWLQGLAIAVAAALLCTVVTWVVVTGRGARSGERGAMSGLGILVVIIAGVSLWQFALHSSGQLAGTTPSLDALAVLAPALCLLALALLCLLATGPALSAVQRLAARGRGISPVLPTRQLARNPAVFSIAILAIVLAAGGTTLVAGVAGTWSDTAAASTQLRAGTDVRVQLDTQLTVGDDPPIIAAPYATLPSVAGAAPVLASPVRIGAEDIDFTSLSSAAIREVMSSVDGRFDNERVASLLSSRPSGFGLPEVASDVTVTLRATSTAGSAGSIAAALWLADSDGSLARLPLGERPLTSAIEGTTLSAELPAAHGSWRVIAVEATLSEAPEASAVAVSFERIEAAGATSGAGHTLNVSSGTPTALGMLATTRDEQLPVVVTHALAEHLGISTGDPLSFVLSTSGQTISATVVGETEVLPGSERAFGLIADLPRLDDYMLRNGGVAAQLNEIWMTAKGQPSTVASAAHGVATSAATITTMATHSPGALIDPAITAFWAGMCGALLLGTMAVLAVVLSLSRQRRGEVAVLRALGMSRAQQARTRIAELGAAAVTALVFGVLCGGIVAALTAGGLTQIATDIPSTLAIGLRFAMLPLLALLGILGVALVAVGGIYGALIRRQAGRGGSETRG